MSFGRIAPPMIAITIKYDALFALVPKPKMPRAKIVGNMIDIKKKQRKMQITEIQPALQKISRQVSTLSSAYRPSILCAENFLNKAAPLKRPRRKQIKPTDWRFAAPLSL